MSTELTTESRETGTRDRGPLTWVVAAAAALVLIGGGVVAVVTLTGDDAPPTAVQPAPATVTTLTGPDAAAYTARCMAPNAEVLSQQEVAFDGTVTSIEGDTVTLSPSQWYAGGPTDVVRVTAPDEQWEQLLSAVHFEDGGRYLVSATDGRVTVCGFSAPYTSELAAIYDQAFE